MTIRSRGFDGGVISLLDRWVNWKKVNCVMVGIGISSITGSFKGDGGRVVRLLSGCYNNPTGGTSAILRRGRLGVLFSGVAVRGDIGDFSTCFGSNTTGTGGRGPTTRGRSGPTGGTRATGSGGHRDRTTVLRVTRRTTGHTRRGTGGGTRTRPRTHAGNRTHRVSAHIGGISLRGCGRGCRSVTPTSSVNSFRGGRGLGRGSGRCEGGGPRNVETRSGERARRRHLTEVTRREGGRRVGVRIPRRVAINSLTDLLEVATGRIVGGLVTLNIVTAIGRIVSCSATTVITARLNTGIRGGIRVSVRRRVVRRRIRSSRGTVPHPPMIYIVNRISRNGASILSTVHRASMASARTNNVARTVNTCRISMGGRGVAFLSAPNRTTFATVHTENTVTASVTILIITTSSNVVPRAVRTVGRTGTTGIRVVITVGGVSGRKTGPREIVRRLARRRLIPRR